MGMGERLFVGLFKHPWITVVLIIGITTLVLSVKQIFDGVAADIDAAENAKQQQKELFAKELEAIRENNQRVAEQLLQLTDLARLQLLGQAGSDSDHDVANAFVRLDRLIDTFEKAMHQPWVRSVVDGYRASVRTLMLRNDQKTESPETLIEVLEDLHKKAISNLRIRTMKDGSIRVQFPVDTNGKPFRLQK